VIEQFVAMRCIIMHDAFSAALVRATGEEKRFWEYTVLDAAPVIFEAGPTTAAEEECFVSSQPLAFSRL
jgi:hypothetical protein